MSPAGRSSATQNTQPTRSGAVQARNDVAVISRSNARLRRACRRNRAAVAIDPRPPSLSDANLHVINPRYPLVANEGYLPTTVTVHDYRHRTEHLNVVGDAVVSGSK